MKKTLLLIVPFLLLLSPLLGQKKTDEPNPKKGIKTETTSLYNYEEKFGEFKEILIDKLIFKYDSNGNRVEESRYDSEGSFKSKYISKYGDKNRRVEKIGYDYELKFGELQERPKIKITYEYEEY